MIDCFLLIGWLVGWLIEGGREGGRREEGGSGSRAENMRAVWRADGALPAPSRSLFSSVGRHEIRSASGPLPPRALADAACSAGGGLATIQRILARTLRKDDAYNSRSAKHI